MDFLLELSDYLSLLKPFTFKDDSLFVELNNSCKKTFTTFCQKKVKFIPFKIGAVKKFLKSTFKAKLINPVKIKFHFFKKGHAYMLDKGEIHFCKDYIFFQPYEKNIVITLHELAHVYLSQQPFYDELLKLDASFFEKYVQNQSLTVISPVEFYANCIAINWVNQILPFITKENRKTLLLQEIEVLQNKIITAINQV